MKIPLSWLKDFIDSDLSPQQIAKTLTMLGLEVDGINESIPNFSQVVIAKVLEAHKHPNADSLVVAKVFDGIEEFQVVCGAPNCRSGIKTAFARVGANLSEEGGATFKVKKTALRGVDSFGMLCSARELQIGTDHDGIIEFDSHLVEGTDIAAMYSDTIFDISLTPNLGHCASILGVARELASVLGISVKLPWKNLSLPAVSSDYKVKIDSPEQCPRYTCCVMEGIKIGPSPEWLHVRLTAAGLRPINNVVDVTNYVLWEMGQPMHAFDKDELNGDTITVKLAQDGQLFKALDGSEHILGSGDITICDARGVIALGGVMGGENSMVTDKTTSILLESACFDPIAIRKTSRRLALMSDSSYRFEKGIDRENCAIALMRAVQLLEEISGGKLVAGVSDSFPGKKTDIKVNCRLSRINQLLGMQLGSGEVEAIFQQLGMPTKFEPAKEIYSVTIPSWRNDLKEEVDLIEEVARLYGYDNIPRHLNNYKASALPDSPIYSFENEARLRSISEGLQEFITCDLISPQQIQSSIDKSIPPEVIVKVLNPSSIEQSILRPTLLPGLLQSVKHNLDRQNRDIQAFEVGRIHYKEGNHYYDKSSLGIVLSGNNTPFDWKTKATEIDFYDLKGIVENILEGLRIQPYAIKKSSLTTLHPGRQAAVVIGECEIGALGEVHPDVLTSYNISQRVYFAEFNLDLLLSMRAPKPILKPLPIYPGSERDWTLTIDESIPAGDILAAVKTMQSRLLKQVSIKDVYRGEKVGPGKKNININLLYRDDRKTISQQAVDAEHERLIQHVTAALKI